MGRFYQTTPKTPVHEPDEVMKAKLQDFEKMILSGNAETAHITNGMRAQVSDVMPHFISHQGPVPRSSIGLIVVWVETSLPAVCFWIWYDCSTKTLAL